MIVRLIKQYPKFIPMYREIYELCRNVEKVMGLFSKELQILDKNTVQYMIDQMQDTIDEQQSTLLSKKVSCLHLRKFFCNKKKANLSSLRNS